MMEDVKNYVIQRCYQKIKKTWLNSKMARTCWCTIRDVTVLIQKKKLFNVSFEEDQQNIIATSRVGRDTQSL